MSLALRTSVLAILASTTMACVTELPATRARQSVPTAVASGDEELMRGKLTTGREIRLEAIVEAAPADVFRLWTTEDGVKRFFAPAAHIDARVGGRYQIIFFPDQDPEGASHGTRGARILKLTPDKLVAFEWITFAGDDRLGRMAPPYAPPALRDVVPLPTWVEVSFEPVAENPPKTLVRLAHRGFLAGQLWDESHAWFGRAWTGVLSQLQAYFQHRTTAVVPPAASPNPEPRSAEVSS